MTLNIPRTRNFFLRDLNPDLHYWIPPGSGPVWRPMRIQDPDSITTKADPHHCCALTSTKFTWGKEDESLKKYNFHPLRNCRQIILKSSLIHYTVVSSCGTWALGSTRKKCSSLRLTEQMKGGGGRGGGRGGVNLNRQAGIQVES